LAVRLVGRLAMAASSSVRTAQALAAAASSVDSPHCSVSRCQPIVETNIRMTAVTCRGVSGIRSDCSRAMSFSAISERLRKALIGRRLPISLTTLVRYG